MTINLNVASGSYGCASPLVLYHVLQFVHATDWSAPPRDAAPAGIFFSVCQRLLLGAEPARALRAPPRDTTTLDYDTATSIATLGTITFVYTGPGGYQTGTGRSGPRSGGQPAATGVSADRRARRVPLAPCASAGVAQPALFPGDHPFRPGRRERQPPIQRRRCKRTRPHQAGGQSRVHRWTHCRQPARGLGVERTAIQLSFILKRYCSGGTVTFSSGFNGASFPGSSINGTSYLALSPSCGAPPPKHQVR